MNEHKTIIALLATIAVLLTLNLVKGERRAEAGVQGVAESDVQPGGGQPYVVNVTMWQNERVFFRFWSDGQVDRTPPRHTPRTRKPLHLRTSESIRCFCNVPIHRR